MTASRRTVKEGICLRLAFFAFANYFCLGREVDRHPAIKGEERAFPE